MQLERNDGSGETNAETDLAFMAEENNRKQAEQKFSDILRRNPSAIAARIELAKLEEEQGNYVKARRNFMVVWRETIDSDDPGEINWRAQAEAHLDMREAVSDFQLAAASESSSSAWYARDYADELSDAKAAAAAYDKAIQNAAGDGELEFHWAKMRLLKWRALSDLGESRRTIAAMVPQTAEETREKADLLRLLNDCVDAVPEYVAAEAESPSSRAPAEYGMSKCRIGKVAEYHLLNAVELDPLNVVYSESLLLLLQGLSDNRDVVAAHRLSICARKRHLCDDTRRKVRNLVKDLRAVKSISRCTLFSDLRLFAFLNLQQEVAGKQVSTNCTTHLSAGSSQRRTVTYSSK